LTATARAIILVAFHPAMATYQQTVLYGASVATVAGPMSPCQSDDQLFALLVTLTEIVPNVQWSINSVQTKRASRTFQMVMCALTQSRIRARPSHAEAADAVTN
jgi:hypothetical protein